MNVPFRIGIGGPIGSGKGGSGITRSDLLVINKIDHAPLVGADLNVLDKNARKKRCTRPFVFTNLKTGEGVNTVVEFILEAGKLPMNQ